MLHLLRACNKAKSCFCTLPTARFVKVTVTLKISIPCYTYSQYRARNRMNCSDATTHISDNTAPLFWKKQFSSHLFKLEKFPVSLIILTLKFYLCISQTASFSLVFRDVQVIVTWLHHAIVEL